MNYFGQKSDRKTPFNRHSKRTNPMTINLTSDQILLLLAVLANAEDNAHRKAYNEPQNANAQADAQSLTDLYKAFLI